jgi:hypothetical protein
LLSVSLFPCRRSHPARVVRRVSQCATAHAAFTFPVAGSASGAAHCRGPLCVRLRYSLETRHPPADGVVERLQEVGFPSPCAPSYRALAFPLVGLPPTEHASLRWTHNRACHFYGTRLSGLLVFRNFGRLKWTSSWHLLQSGMLLRLRAIMIFIQGGFSLRPFLFRSARCRTWCIWMCSLLPHTSQVLFNSLSTISDLLRMYGIKT